MKMDHTLETERLILRCFEDDDLADHVAVLSNWDVTQWASNNIPFPYTEKDGAQYIKEARSEYAEGSSYRFAVIEKATGQFTGSIRLFSPQNRESEVGYGLGPASWGKGYATEALKALVEFARAEGVIKELQAQTSAKNEGSRRVLEKAGFLHRGEVPEEISRCGHADGCSEFYTYSLAE